MARLRAGAPIRYITTVTGSTPYSTKVMQAPSSVPLLWLASATAIISATYSQARGTMCIDDQFGGVLG